MADIVQQFGHRLIRMAVPAIRSLALLAITLGLGYFVGQRWGEAQGDPNGMLYGLIGGFAIWALFLRPRRRRRKRRGGGYTDDQSDSSDNSGWSGDDDGDDDGGGDD